MRREARARREQRRTGLDLRGRTPAGYAAQRLNEMLDRNRTKKRTGAPDKAAPPWSTSKVRFFPVLTF